MRNPSRPAALFSIFLLLAAGPMAGGLNAQELEEIVVTAERRSENLQEVPNAITALSRLTIEKADIHDLTDIATRVPGADLLALLAGPEHRGPARRLVQRRRRRHRQFSGGVRG